MKTRYESVHNLGNASVGSPKNGRDVFIMRRLRDMFEPTIPPFFPSTPYHPTQSSLMRLLWPGRWLSWPGLMPQPSLTMCTLADVRIGRYYYLYLVRGVPPSPTNDEINNQPVRREDSNCWIMERVVLFDPRVLIFVNFDS